MDYGHSKITQQALKSVRVFSTLVWILYGWNGHYNEHYTVRMDITQLEWTLYGRKRMTRGTVVVRKRQLKISDTFGRAFVESCVAVLCAAYIKPFLGNT